MRRKRNAVKVLAYAFLVVLAAASAVIAMGDARKSPDIRVENASAQLSPAMLGVASVFMSIMNTGDGDVLTSASVDMKGTVTELHDMKEGKMVKIDRIEIPAMATVELKPMSLHIMVFGLPHDLEQGTKIRVTLVFERSGKQQIMVPLRSGKSMNMHSGHH